MSCAGKRSANPWKKVEVADERLWRYIFSSYCKCGTGVHRTTILRQPGVRRAATACCIEPLFVPRVPLGWTASARPIHMFACEAIVIVQKSTPTDPLNKCEMQAAIYGNLRNSGAVIYTEVAV